jgi:methylated-DNA-protein-cysteine methyltransferase-like protein
MYLNPNAVCYFKKEPNQMNTKLRNEDIYTQIYAVVRAIPKGRVSSYGAIAAALGLKSAARLVGYAMNQAHMVVPKVPAHRVVNRIGLLTGKHHFSPPERMQQLLESEGIKIKDDQVQEFEKVFWDPQKELL